MTERDNLDHYLDTYQNDPFADENQRGLQRFIDYCVEYRVSDRDYLELGIGHGVTLPVLSQHFQHVTVLEGAPRLVQAYRGRFANVAVVETYFEDYETTQRFDHIGLGFVLEHVADPAVILQRYAALLNPNGRLLIGVPNAASMHRWLAHRAGMLDDLRQLTPTDLAFGHKRLWTHDDWRRLLENNGLTIRRMHGLVLKPFTTLQLASLQLDPRIIRALDELSGAYPELANGLFIEASL